MDKEYRELLEILAEEYDYQVEGALGYAREVLQEVEDNGGLSRVWYAETGEIYAVTTSNAWIELP